MRKNFLLLLLLMLPVIIDAAEYHVSPDGNDQDNDGSTEHPFKTIMRAAFAAYPGDTITVHEGVYREWINPPRGGASDSLRITYQAAPGENVVIKGSEIIKDWKKNSDGLWEAKPSWTMFGTVNPYRDLIAGDYLKHNSGQHTGMVYLNGKPIPEAVSFKEFIQNKKSSAPAWKALPDFRYAHIFLRLPEGVDPNKETVEINARRAAFYPTKEQINYITLRGFHIMHTASNWAPPTAEQIAAVGTHWSKGWIIENNIIEYSRCAGLSLGKYGNHYDNTYKDSQSYVSMIERAVKYYGWNGKEVGHHIVRNNTIAYCGQAGIVGGMGAIFSVIEGNDIHNIAVNQRFDGFETACIKLHGAVDVLIADNHLHHCNGFAGLWLDWMAQGTRVTRNVFHDNKPRDFYLEVNHGPVLLDNNLFLSPQGAVSDSSDGIAYVNNLFACAPLVSKDAWRVTPFFLPHSTDIAGYIKIETKDIRIINNIFVASRETGKNVPRLDDPKGHSILQGNVYLNGAKPYANDKASIVEPNFNPEIKVYKKNQKWYLTMKVNPDWLKAKRHIVTTELLKKAIVSNAMFTNPNGTPYVLNKDFLGNTRRVSSPGPFILKDNETELNVEIWPNAHNGEYQD